MTSIGVTPKTASLIVVDPSGTRTRTNVTTTPLSIGRNPENHIVLRDSRVSRTHARIVAVDGALVVEDLQSSHGTWINGQRVASHVLEDGDKIEFGIPDSYTLYFSFGGDELHRILDQFPQLGSATAEIQRLRSLVEVARALHNSLSTRDVLTAVVDACLTITEFDRGFLFLRKGELLEIAVARDKVGRPLSEDDLEVPVHTINTALEQRRDLLSMTFDPHSSQTPSS
ncbi:MAG TPA: FHA domain-containing protein, partial [Bryobacteraceae bacterium]|nr:FHA domain-containing protein [Bryobacteraceae bacterium]